MKKYDKLIKMFHDSKSDLWKHYCLIDRDDDFFFSTLEELNLPSTLVCAIVPRQVIEKHFIKLYNEGISNIQEKVDIRLKEI